MRRAISAAEAATLIPDGAKLMFGGFMGIGTPERIRAGGSGLGGVLTPTGVGTVVQEGKRVVEIDGVDFLLELPLRADFALLHAHEADYNYNLTYRLTAMNFNPVIAFAAEYVIAEPDQIVPVGVIPPDSVRTPGILVHHLVERPH